MSRNEPKTSRPTGGADEDSASRPETCALCGRTEELTEHHLIPKSQHKKNRTKKKFDRHEMKEKTIWVCLPCHKNIHKSISEKELADIYNAPEVLGAHPDIEKFTSWIKKKPPGFLPKGGY